MRVSGLASSKSGRLRLRIAMSRPNRQWNILSLWKRQRRRNFEDGDIKHLESRDVVQVVLQSPDRPCQSGPRSWRQKACCFVLGCSLLVVLSTMLDLILWARLDLRAASSAASAELPRRILPIPCHSHNDYWRKQPVFSALQAGCVGIEADVWLSKGELYVGHDRRSLSEGETFTKLYVDPLVTLLEERNAAGSVDGFPRGIFAANPTQTLVLLVDLKTEAHDTWPEVLLQLEPLRRRGWLSDFADGRVRYGPITVVGTGNTDFALLMTNGTHRDYFFDAPIDRLQGSTFDPTNSYYTSNSFKATIGYAWFGGLSQTQLRKLREQIRDAHAHGLKARYWNLPSWPISVRNHIWDVLIREGVDMINVDDVKGAQRLWETKGWPTLL